MELPPLAAMARATETLLSLCPCFLQSSQQPLQCSASKPLLPQVTFLWSGPCPDDSIGCRHTHWAELQEDGEDLGGMSRGGGEGRKAARRIRRADACSAGKSVSLMLPAFGCVCLVGSAEATVPCIC